MNILIIGSGGREHALAWKMAASPLADKLYCAPGNAGIAQEAECVPLDIANHAAVTAFCKEKKVDFVVVGSFSGTVDFGGLKMKLLSSIVAISAIRVLKAFMNVGSYDDKKLWWMAGIHLVFLCSMLVAARSPTFTSG